MRVLIVDDEIITRISLSDYLCDAGFEVDAVESTDKAIMKQSCKAYNVCIVDIRLPGTDGVETIRNLYQRHNATKFIIYTGSPRFTLSEDLKLVGLAEKNIVRKPVIDMQVFVDLIEELT
jgi:DNA-binding NtrC family response regulator